MKGLIILQIIFLQLSSEAQISISKQIEKNINLSNVLLKTDHTQAYNFAKKALDYSKSGVADDKITSISNFISVLIEKGDFPTAYQYLAVLKILSEQTNSKKGLFDYYYHTSSVLIQEGFYKEAGKFIDTSFSIARQQNFTDTGWLFYSLALIDIETLKVKPAIINLEKAYAASTDDIRLMRLCKICVLPYTGFKSKLISSVSDMDTVIANLEKDNDLFMLGQLYNMIGNAYFLNFNFPLANKNFNLANEHFFRINSPFFQATNMLFWAPVLDMQNKTDSALVLSRQIIEKFEKLNYNLGLSMVHMFTSRFYGRLKDSANAKKHRELSENYNKTKNAVINANNMLGLANEKKGSNSEDANKIVNDATKLLKDFTKVNPGLIKIPINSDSANAKTILKNLENLVNEIDFVKDSITQKKNADALQELETKYKTSQKNDSLRIQKQQLKLNETQLKLKETQKRNLMVGIGLVGSFALLIGFLLFVLYQQKKKIIREKRAVINLTGILKHETSRQFGELKTNIKNILKVDQPKLQVAKALTRVKTYEMLYNNLFISDGLATISLKNAFEKIFEYHCDENASVEKPAFSITGGENIVFNKSDYLFQYMNELMANSFEHAFSGIENPEINVSIVYHKPVYEITYRDNGIGFPEEKQRIIQGKGMYYIQAYATQNLNGNLEINARLTGSNINNVVGQGKNGTEYKLTFNENNI